jgi:hypothetical protein
MHAVILRAAGLLVRRDQRAEWLDEWTAELAFVRYDSPRRATLFCLGAFRDALWVRRNTPAPESHSVLLESPLRCLLLLSVLAISAGFCYQLPGPRNMFAAEASADVKRMVVITHPAGKFTVERYQWLAQHLPWEFTEIWLDHGRVLGLRRPGMDRAESRWRIHIPNDNGEQATFNCDKLQPRDPLYVLLVTGGLALLILVATTPLSIGEYPARASTRVRLWSFFAVKVTLAAIIVFFGVLDVGSVSAVEIRPHGLLVGFVLAFRWAIQDQRGRCPVCLRRLTNPIRFGGPSHAFLDWYGTELICAAGHGMMHVPEIPTSCYPEPRWVSLDA